MRLTQTNANLAAKKDSGGFTLTELIVATAITSIVLTLAGMGLMGILTANQAAEQRQNRRQELGRALAFIADDIRAAQRINKNGANQTVLASAAVTAASPPLSYASSIAGTVALYLEIPMDAPATCPGGAAMPNPSNVDRVTYEIRTKRTEFLNSTPTLNEKLWRGPYILYRHGRIPRLDGGVNPCSEPVASEVLVDGLLNENASIPPSCGPTTSAPAPVLSGIGGFYTCVVGDQVALLLRGDGSPQPWENRTVNPGVADVVPVTLTSLVFQRGIAPASTPAIMCNVPNLLGKTQTNAKISLSSANLRHNAVADPLLNTAPSIVASQIPTPGTALPCNQIVTFTYKP
jgi:prepilin-type N-terminal cleavage/methylation domain-containing protein